MATILARVKQLIFGETGDVSGFGQIGAGILGTDVKTKDLATIQALSLFKEGLAGITNSNVPYLQDANSLNLLVTSQLAYLFQNGFPEYDAETDYFNLISFVQVNGVVYQSIFGDGTTANVGNDPTSSPTKWRNVDPYTIGQGLAAEITRAEAAEAAISSASGLTYVQTKVTESGLAWDASDAYILDKADIGDSHLVGEDLYMGIPVTQTYFGAARSSANPGYPRYSPVIERNVDKVISTSQSLALVTAKRAFKASFLGVDTFPGIVAGSGTFTITFGSSTALNAALAVINAEALVRQWFVSQDADFQTTGPLPGGGPSPMTMNVAGTDYQILSINTTTRVIQGSGSPSTGTQNCSFYPYRIAGSSTTIQLPKLSGFAPVASGDSDGVVIEGYRVMDTIQGHWHSSYWTSFDNPGVTAALGSITTGDVAPVTTGRTTLIGIRDSITDGTNGPPRIAKNNSPRTNSRRVYTWAHPLLAAA